MPKEKEIELVALLNIFIEKYPGKEKFLADELSVSLPTINRWGTGENLPHSRVSKSIIQHLWMLLRIDHSSGLCDKPTIANLSLKDAKKNPPKCQCCRVKMQVFDDLSISFQQLGMYRVVCTFCPDSNNQ